MIKLCEQDIEQNNRQSSKGNQLKWLQGNMWYKADYTGYEGMAEYAVSNLLKYSSFNAEEYINYNTEEIQYENVKYLGCSSINFLKEGWQLITLERLFQNYYGKSLYRSIYMIDSVKERVRFLVEQIIRITGLKDFGVYISKLLTIDAFFLNEDRHTHNIAVLMDEEGTYHYCPVFDNGAGLLSDTTMDYPMHVELQKLIGNAASKTFCKDFDEQLDAAEQMYGRHIKFHFREADIRILLECEKHYPVEVKERVMSIIREQSRKYQYLF